MKNSDPSSSSHDSGLRQVLESWEVSAGPPANFQREVWRRISAREAGNSPSRSWLEFVGEQLARPTVAASVAAVVLLSAVSGARIHSEIAEAQTLRKLGLQYAVSIDPLARSTHRFPR